MKKLAFIFIILIILVGLIYLIASYNFPIIVVHNHFILAKDYFKHKKAFDYLKKSLIDKNQLPNEWQRDDQIKKLIIEKLINVALYEREIKKRNLQSQVEIKLQEYLKDLPEYSLIEAEVSYGLKSADFIDLVIKPYFEYQILKENFPDIDEKLKQKSGIIILPWIYFL